MYYGLINSMNKGAGYTARTTAFATATGITDTTILGALNTFDLGLISNSLDTKMKALYPFVGGTATTHKYNFMDARDLDAAFRLQFSGGWTWSSTGAKPNNSNGYANTYLTPSTHLTTYNSHVSMYTRNNGTVDGFDIGATNAGPYNKEFLLASLRGGSSIVALYDFGTSAMTVASSASGIGFFEGSIVSSSLQKLYKNGSVLATNTSTNTSLPAEIPLWIGGTNASGSLVEKTDKEFAFISLGSGLNDSESSTLYSLVQAMETSLNRQI